MYFVFGIFVHENKIGRILTEYSNTKNAIVSALFIILEAMYLSRKKTLQAHYLSQCCHLSV